MEFKIIGKVIYHDGSVDEIFEEVSKKDEEYIEGIEESKDEY